MCNVDKTLSLSMPRLLVFVKIILADLDLRCCTRTSLSCGEQGLLLVEVHRLLLFWSTGSRYTGSMVVAHGLSC